MAEFPTKLFWLPKLKLGKPNAIQTAQLLTGVSQVPTLGSSLKNSTHQSMCDRVLGLSDTYIC
jgi:hypothetical protein